MPNRRYSDYADDGLARQTIAKQKIRYRRRTGSGTGQRLGVNWTDIENEKILKQVKPDRELAVELQRSVQAIQVHRARLKGKK